MSDLVEEKAAAERDHHQKADEKLVQANSKITELEAKLTGLQRELTVLQKQGKRTPIDQGDLFDFSDFKIRGNVWQIQPEKEEGPGLSYFYQLWGLLPQ